MLPDNFQADRILPFFIVHNLPAGVKGILIASIFAAGMSTISTSVNSSATVILNDYFVNKKRNDGKEKREMKILYISSLVFSFISIGIAVAMIGVQSALEAWWKLASVFSGGMLGLFLLGFFTKNTGNRAAAAGVVSGIIIIGWMSLSPVLFKGSDLQYLASPFHSYLSIVFGTMLIFIVGFMAGFAGNYLRKKSRISR